MHTPTSSNRARASSLSLEEIDRALAEDEALMPSPEVTAAPIYALLGMDYGPHRSGMFLAEPQPATTATPALAPAIAGHNSGKAAAPAPASDKEAKPLPAPASARAPAPALATAPAAAAAPAPQQQAPRPLPVCGERVFESVELTWRATKIDTEHRNTECWVKQGRVWVYLLDPKFREVGEGENWGVKAGDPCTVINAVPGTTAVVNVIGHMLPSHPWYKLSTGEWPEEDKKVEEGGIDYYNYCENLRQEWRREREEGYFARYNVFGKKYY